MTGRPIIRLGDKTTHGGTVMEGFSSYSIDGRAAAGLPWGNGQGWAKRSHQCYR